MQASLNRTAKGNRQQNKKVDRFNTFHYVFSISDYECYKEEGSMSSRSQKIENRYWPENWIKSTPNLQQYGGSMM